MSEKNTNTATITSAAPLRVMQTRDLDKARTTAKVTKIAGTVLIYVFLILIAFIVLFPFYWMLISSVKTLDEYQRSVPTLFPKVIVLHNYVEAFNQANLGRLFLNTVYVGLVSTAASLVITVL